MTTPEIGPGRRFAVALSFAGEYREVVKEVADALARALNGKERILYDKYHEAEFARPNLDIYLPDLYRHQADLLVVFLCPQYAQKRWCTLEWRHIRTLLTTVEEGRIMLVSFGPPGDLTQIGVLPGDGYIDVNALRPGLIAGKIVERFEVERARALPPSAEEPIVGGGAPPPVIGPRSGPRRHLLALGLAAAAVALVTVGFARLGGRRCDPGAAAVFPRIGCAEIIDSQAQGTTSHRTTPCDGKCLPAAGSAMEIQSHLEASGFGVLLFRMREPQTPMDASTVLARARIVSGARKFEVALMDSRSRIGLLHCEAPARDGVYDYVWRFARDELERAGCKVVPQDAIQLSVGFSAVAGSGPGDHVMELLGVQPIEDRRFARSSGQVACRLAPCAPPTILAPTARTTGLALAESAHRSGATDGWDECGLRDGGVALSHRGGDRPPGWIAGCCVEVGAPTIFPAGAKVAARYSLASDDEVEVFFEQGDFGLPAKKGYLVNGPLSATSPGGSTTIGGQLRDDDGRPVDVAVERVCVNFRNTSGSNRARPANAIRVWSIEGSAWRSVDEAEALERR